MHQHYLTSEHQSAIIGFVRRILNKSQEEQYERSSGMDIDTTPTNFSNTTAAAHPPIHDTPSASMQEVYEAINVLASGIQTLNDDVQRLSSDSIRAQTSVESLTQDLAALQLGIHEQTAFMDGIKPNQEILHQDVASLKQKVDDLQYVSYDGTLVWKITSFHEKMSECWDSCLRNWINVSDVIDPLVDAQSERQTSIYSPPFYSSPTGYKMRARLYLHGDGNARRTHMSLFFVLMRGPNDAILKFPFNYKVTFCLYDQTPQQRHIIDSFRPDIKSNSFQRPRSEMNIASGIPKFFPLAMIQQEGNPYVQEDTMFIKIMVDFGDLPKTMLPYALSLNPGLPMHIQQSMIRQETERRSQQSTTATTRPPNADPSSPQTLYTVIPSSNQSNENTRTQDPNSQGSNTGLE